MSNLRKRGALKRGGQDFPVVQAPLNPTPKPSDIAVAAIPDGLPAFNTKKITIKKPTLFSPQSRKPLSSTTQM